MVSDYIAIASSTIALLALIFTIYNSRTKKAALTREAELKVEIDRLRQSKRLELEVVDEYQHAKEEEDIKTAREAYQAILRNELGSIKMVGTPDIQDMGLDLPDVFVQLNISEQYQSEEHVLLEDPERGVGRERDFSPDEVLRRAYFDYNRRLLLIIGDPGSGKTTLLKYYALISLDPNGYKQLQFDKPYYPIFLPLRNVNVEETLAENLNNMVTTHRELLNAKVFHKWLDKKPTLVLLDGLDEVSELEERKKVCRWIKKQHHAYSKARFIVTSRWTGYGQSEGVVLDVPYLRADVRDFTEEQQEEFLNKWFKGAYLCETIPPEGRTPAWEARRIEEAKQKAQSIVDWLKEPGNKSLRQLAGIPMILQLIALIWKDRKYKAGSRNDLYNAALNYLLDYRDTEKDLKPILTYRDARSVLSPVALWLQDEHKDEVKKVDMHEQMQPHLNETAQRPQAQEFCSNLRDRAGLIADYGSHKEHYIFRHKSFREYLAGLQLVKKYREKERMQKIIQDLQKDWWHEPLRFMIAEAEDGDLFDRFMAMLFASEVSRELPQKALNLLYDMVREARRRKPDALIKALNNPQMNSTQQRYILECLKLIGSDAALAAIRKFKESHPDVAGDIRDKTDDILYDAGELEAEAIVITSLQQFDRLPKPFRNPFEYNAEYILLPSGKFHYSLTDKDEPISPFYMAKYPVTNKQYRRFIRYLSGAEEELRLIDKLPVHVFGKQLLQYAQEIVGFSAYLGNDSGRWPAKLKAGTDEKRNFDGDDQPVVAIAWYAAHAYCFWLTLLTAKQQKRDLADLQMVYRLPHEKEWERAAAGTNEEGGPREYPWGKKTPDDKRANFNNNIGHTTPVGRYPDGATPHGLQDMAGNVWEWQGNWYDKEEKARVLRGGSFFVSANFLHCSNRHWYNPVNRRDSFGFRVVLAPLL